MKPTVKLKKKKNPAITETDTRERSVHTNAIPVTKTVVAAMLTPKKELWANNPRFDNLHYQKTNI